MSDEEILSQVDTFMFEVTVIRFLKIEFLFKLSAVLFRAMIQLRVQLPGSFIAWQPITKNRSKIVIIIYN